MKKVPFLAALAVSAAVFSPPAWSQTKPATETPRIEKSQAQAMIAQLLKEGKIMRSSDVKRGMRGIGRSVFQGTKIEEFHIEVIGTLKKVMGGGDLVLIKVLDGPVVKRQSGIIAGMSGSPVYINGKMLGAIAIGFGFPKEPIGGVTPITQMIAGALPDNAATHASPKSAKTPLKPVAALANDAYRPTEPLSVAGRKISQVVVSRDPRRLALSGSVHNSTMTMRPATMLMQVSGFSEKSLPRLKEMFAPWGIEPILGTGGGMMGSLKGASGVQAAMTASEKTDANPPFVPGGAIGVPLVTGDLDMSGVGTITFRWGQRILAFGHPMFGKGAVSMPMTSAYIHDIFPSYQQSFKLASPVREVGALQQDTEFAIGGTVGRRADMVPMHIRIRNAERQINRTYNVRLIKDPLFTPLLIQMVGGETLSGALGMESDKMVRVAFRMDVAGAPSIVRRDYLYAQGDVAMPALGDLFESVMLTQMNPFSRADIKNISLDVSLEPVRRTARIRRITADRNRAKAGDTVRVNVLLEPHETPDQYITRVFNFTIPADAPDGALRIAVGPASDFWTNQSRVGGAPPKPNNLKELIEAYAQAGASDELLVQASTPNTFLMVGRQKVSNPPPSWAVLVPPRASTSIAAYNETQTQREKLNYSLSGSQFLSIPVESGRHSDRQRPDSGSSDGAKATTTSPAMSMAMSGADEAAYDPSEFDIDEGEEELAARTSWRNQLWVTRVLRSPAFGPYMKTWWKSVTRNADLLANNAAQSPELPAPAAIMPSITPVKPAAIEKADTSADASPTATPEPNGNLARPASKWVQDTATAFGKGTFDGTAVSSDGSVRPAPATKLLSTTTQPVAWSIATRGGVTYVGFGHEARLLRIDGQGSATTLYEGPEVAVTALTTDEKGNLYAALAPGGRVLRFANGGGAPITIFDSKATFVWALEWDDKGRLLVATGGQKGALYRLSDPATRFAAEGEIAPLATVPQKHIRALAVRGSDIFATTADDGVLYQISEAGAVRALYEAGANPPAAAIAMSGERPDLSALMMAQRMMMGAGGSPMMMGGGDAMMLMAGAEGAGVSGGALRSQGIEITSVVAAPEGLYFGTSNSGAIYRWTPENGATTVYNAPARAVYALRRSADGKIYAAVAGSGSGNVSSTNTSSAVAGAITSAMLPTGGGGPRGAVYEITPAPLGASASDSRAVRLIETTQPQVVALGLGGADLVAATANNAAIYRVVNGTAGIGTYTSNVLDAGRIVRWGALRALAERAQIETRSGNTQEPDATWSAWQSAGEISGETRVASPAARYLQYRAKLNAGGTLSRLEVIYRPQNQAPTVNFASPAGGEFLKDKKKISWTGKDPDSDTLRYKLSFSRDNGASWQNVELKKPSATSYEIEGKKWPDGAYIAKIEASDANRNPEDPRSDDATSRAFTLDSTAPKLDGQAAQKQGDTWKLRAVASDTLAPIAGAEWRVFTPKPEKPAKKDDAKTEGKTVDAAFATDGDSEDDEDEVKPKEAEWHALAAADGIFDGRREELVGLIEAATLPQEIKSGTQIEIRARDAAGNSVIVMVTLP